MTVILQYVVVCASFFDIVCLCIYINSIVNYEKQLLNFARSYIEYNQNSFKIEKGGILPKDADDNKDKERQFTEVVKSIGDLDKTAEILRKELQKLKSDRLSRNADYADLQMAFQTADAIDSASAMVFVCYMRDDANEHGERMDWGLSAQAFEVADIQSIGACIENMLLVAESMSIASLWVCDVLYAESAISVAFGMEYPLVAAVLLGKAALQQSAREDLSQKAKWYV